MQIQFEAEAIFRLPDWVNIYFGSGAWIEEFKSVRKGSWEIARYTIITRESYACMKNWVIALKLNNMDVQA